MHCPNIFLKFYIKRWKLNIVDLSFKISIVYVLQKLKANVLVADRKMRKLIFSLRRKENEELAEKKRNLMVNALVRITFLELAWSIYC